MTLNELEIGEKALVKYISDTSSLKQRFTDIGIACRELYRMCFNKSWKKS